MYGARHRLLILERPEPGARRPSLPCPAAWRSSRGVTQTTLLEVIERRLAEISARQHARWPRESAPRRTDDPFAAWSHLTRSCPGPAEIEGHPLAWHGRGEGVRPSFFGDPLEIGRPTAEERHYSGTCSFGDGVGPLGRREAQMVTSSTTRSHTRLHQPSLDFAPVVLVVDDKRMIRELCREALERDHLRVLSAANGDEALALADRWIVDVLVTDIVMPGLDGFGLLRALRHRYPGMSAIVMTGDSDYHGRPVHEVATQHGVVWTLLKPFDASLLCEAVRGQCEVSARFATTGSSTDRPIPRTTSEGAHPQDSC